METSTTSVVVNDTVTNNLRNLSVITGADLNQSRKTVRNVLSKYLTYLNRVDAVKHPYTKYDGNVPYKYFLDSEKDDWENQLKQWFGQFADFIITEMSSTVLKYNTALDYLKVGKGILRDDYVQLRIPLNESTCKEWWDKLIKNVRKHYIDNLKPGQKLVDSAPPSTESDEHLMARIEFSKNRKEGNETRLMVVLDRNLFGRINELCRISLQSLSWMRRVKRYRGPDEKISWVAENHLLVNFKRSKESGSGGIQKLAVVLNASNWESCALHALACYLATYTPKDDMLFVSLQKNPCSRMNDILERIYDNYVNCMEDTENNPLSAWVKDFVETNGELTKLLTSHSNRRGGAQQGANNYRCTVDALACRGGWLLEAKNKIFVYLTGNDKSDLTVARQMSGWEKVNNICGVCPGIDCISEESKVVFQFFAALLYPTLSEEHMRWSLTCVLLLYHDEVKESFGDHNIVNIIETKIQEAFERCGITNKDTMNSTISLWKHDVRESFIQLNLEGLPLDRLQPDTSIPAATFIDVVRHNSSAIALNTRQIKTIDDRLDGMVHEMTSLKSELTKTRDDMQIQFKQLCTDISKVMNMLNTLSQRLTADDVVENPETSIDAQVVSPTQTSTLIRCQTFPQGGVKQYQKYDIANLFIEWYEKEMYKITCKDKVERKFLRKVGRLVCYMKLFLPDGTNIDPHPMCDNAMLHIQWISRIRQLGSISQKKMAEFIIREEVNAKMRSTKLPANSTNIKQRKRTTETLTLESVLKKMQYVNAHMSGKIPCTTVVDTATEEEYLFTTI